MPNRRRGRRTLTVCLPGAFAFTKPPWNLLGCTAATARRVRNRSSSIQRRRGAPSPRARRTSRSVGGPIILEVMTRRLGAGRPALARAAPSPCVFCDAWCGVEAPRFGGCAWGGQPRPAHARARTSRSVGGPFILEVMTRRRRLRLMSSTGLSLWVRRARSDGDAARARAARPARRLRLKSSTKVLVSRLDEHVAMEMRRARGLRAPRAASDM